MKTISMFFFINAHFNASLLITSIDIKSKILKSGMSEAPELSLGDGPTGSLFKQSKWLNWKNQELEFIMFPITEGICLHSAKLNLKTVAKIRWMVVANTLL